MTYQVNPDDEGRVIDCPAPECDDTCKTCGGHGWVAGKPRRAPEEFDPPEFTHGPAADYIN